MALNFPDSPALNEIYKDSTSGFSYKWNGSVWISYSSASANNIKPLDDISASFNGSTTIFPLYINGVSIAQVTSEQLIISLGGVMQEPNADYSVSGTSIVFSTPPNSQLSFFGTIIGAAIPVGISTVGDVYNRQSYAVTGIQTNFTFSAGYTVGYLEVFRNGVKLISGSDFTATTGTGFSLNPAAQNTDDIEAVGYKVSSVVVAEGNLINLTVNNNAIVLGITTLGNTKVTGSISVGTGLTLSSEGVTAGIVTATRFTGTFVGDGSGLIGVAGTGNGIIIRDDGSLVGTAATIDFGSNLNVSPISAGIVTVSLSTTGIVTATTFVGNLTGTASTAGAATTAYGLAGTPNLNVGVVTATSFKGDGSQLTNIPAGSNLSSIIGYNSSGARNDGANGRLDIFGNGNFRVFTTPGTFNTNPGISSIRVRVIGAGGNGGTGGNTGPVYGFQGSGGGGGGGGGYAHKVITSPNFPGPGAYSVTVGSAPGGTSSFDTVSATGGSNGTSAAPFGTSPSTPGGAGGTATGGDVNYTGATGLAGPAGSTPGPGAKGGAAATQLGNGSGASVPGLPAVNNSYSAPGSPPSGYGVVVATFRDTSISRFPFDIFNGYASADGATGAAGASPSISFSGLNGGAGGNGAGSPGGSPTGGNGGYGGGGGGGSPTSTTAGNGGAGGYGAGGGGGGGYSGPSGFNGLGGAGGAGVVVVEW